MKSQDIFDTALLKLSVWIGGITLFGKIDHMF